LNFFYYNILRSKYYALLIRASKISLNKDIFFNLFAHIKQYIDNIFIERLAPLDYYVSNFGTKRNNKLAILLLGSIYNKLNMASISHMIYKFVSLDGFENNEKKTFKYKFPEDQMNALKVERFFLLIYWELTFPISMFCYRIAIVVSFRLYIVFRFFFYLLFCLMYFLFCVLKFF